MGCQQEVILGDSLTFSVTTHDPDTWLLADADAEPTYRIYEEETGIPLLTGDMAKLDDANTTGFYVKKIACTAGNGFEVGKTYTVYIEAVVNLFRGATSHAFVVKEGTAVGASSVVYTVTVGGLPLAGVFCRMTSDVTGLAQVDAGTTNALGQVTFHHDLPSSTPVWIWRTLAGYSFADPDAETIP
jgi:hypothetical protein